MALLMVLLVLMVLIILVGIASVWLLFDIHGGSADRGGAVARGAVACVHLSIVLSSGMHSFHRHLSSVVRHAFICMYLLVVN